MLFGIDTNPCNLSLRNRRMSNYGIKSKQFALKKCFCTTIMLFIFFWSFNVNRFMWINGGFFPAICHVCFSFFLYCFVVYFDVYIVYILTYDLFTINDVSILSFIVSPISNLCISLSCNSGLVLLCFFVLSCDDFFGFHLFAPSWKGQIFAIIFSSSD